MDEPYLLICCRRKHGTSHKGKTLRHYTVEFKLNVIEYAEKFTFSSDTRQFNVDRRMVSHWVQKKADRDALSMTIKGNSRKRFDVGGRKPLSEQLENELLEWDFDMKYEEIQGGPEKIVPQI